MKFILIPLVADVPPWAWEKDHDVRKKRTKLFSGNQIVSDFEIQHSEWEWIDNRRDTFSASTEQTASSFHTSFCPPSHSEISSKI